MTSHHGVDRVARVALIVLILLVAWAGVTLAEAPAGSAAPLPAAQGPCGPVACASVPVKQNPCGPVACASVPANQGPCGPVACASVPVKQNPCGPVACAAPSSPGAPPPTQAPSVSAPPITEAPSPVTPSPGGQPPGAVTSTTDGGFRAGRTAPGQALPKGASQNATNWVLPVILLAVVAAVFLALVVRRHRRLRHGELPE